MSCRERADFLDTNTQRKESRDGNQKVEWPFQSYLSYSSKSRNGGVMLDELALSGELFSCFLF